MPDIHVIHRGTRRFARFPRLAIDDSFHLTDGRDETRETAGVSEGLGPVGTERSFGIENGRQGGIAGRRTTKGACFGRRRTRTGNEADPNGRSGSGALRSVGEAEIEISTEARAGPLSPAVLIGGKTRSNMRWRHFGAVIVWVGQRKDTQRCKAKRPDGPDRTRRRRELAPGDRSGPSRMEMSCCPKGRRVPAPATEKMRNPAPRGPGIACRSMRS